MIIWIMYYIIWLDIILRRLRVILLEQASEFCKNYSIMSFSYQVNEFFTLFGILYLHKCLPKWYLE